MSTQLGQASGSPCSPSALQSPCAHTMPRSFYVARAAPGSDRAADLEGAPTTGALPSALLLGSKPWPVGTTQGHRTPAGLAGKSFAALQRDLPTQSPHKHLGNDNWLQATFSILKDYAESCANPITKRLYHNKMQLCPSGHPRPSLRPKAPADGDPSHTGNGSALFLNRARSGPRSLHSPTKSWSSCPSHTAWMSALTSRGSHPGGVTTPWEQMTMKA